MLFPHRRTVADKQAGLEVGHVQKQHAVLFQKPVDAGYEVVQVGDVLNHLARQDKVEQPVFGDDLVADALVDPGFIDAKPLVASHAPGHGVGFDADTDGDSPVRQRLQEGAVVAAEFNGVCKRPLGHDGVDFVFQVGFRLPGAEVVIEVRIEDFRVDGVEPLDQPAVAAEMQRHGIGVFGFVPAFQQPVGNGPAVEVDHRLQVRSLAKAAGVGHGCFITFRCWRRGNLLRPEAGPCSLLRRRRRRLPATRGRFPSSSGRRGRWWIHRKQASPT